MNQKRFSLTILTIFLAFTTHISLAFSDDSDEPHYFLGDLGRSSLEENGVKINSFLSNEVVSNLSGGKSRGSRFHGIFDLTGEVDTEKSGLWDKGTFFTHFIAIYGASPIKMIGDIQAVSNIDAPINVLLYEAWYKHSLLDDKISITVGLHDANTEFNVLNYSIVLLNGSFGVDPVISQNALSTYPTTALGGMLKVKPFEGIYFNNAIYDGIPGDPNKSRGTHIDFKSGDGIFWISELGLTPQEEQKDLSEYYKVAVGYWDRTTETQDISGSPIDSNHGIYLMGEKGFFTEDDKSQGLGSFFRLGYAPDSKNNIARYVSAGLNYKGLIDGRDSDTTAFGFSSAIIGNNSVDSDTTVARHETTIELTDRIEISPIFALQPDLQYIINPGASKEFSNAWAFTVRADLTL